MARKRRKPGRPAVGLLINPRSKVCATLADAIAARLRDLGVDGPWTVQDIEDVIRMFASQQIGSRDGEPIEGSGGGGDGATVGGGAPGSATVGGAWQDALTTSNEVPLSSSLSSSQLPRSTDYESVARSYLDKRMARASSPGLDNWNLRHGERVVLIDNSSHAADSIQLLTEGVVVDLVDQAGEASADCGPEDQYAERLLLIRFDRVKGSRADRTISWRHLNRVPQDEPRPEEYADAVGKYGNKKYASKVKAERQRGGTGVGARTLDWWDRQPFGE